METCPSCKSENQCCKDSYPGCFSGIQRCNWPTLTIAMIINDQTWHFIWEDIFFKASIHLCSLNPDLTLSRISQQHMGRYFISNLLIQP